MKMRFNISVLILTLPLLLLSCGRVKKGAMVPAKIDLPERFSIYSEEPAGPDRWWTNFEAPELDRLIGEALSASFTIKEAWARLRQVEASAVQAGSSFYPDLNLTVDASSARSPGQSANSYSLALAGSYELDLWGRVRSQNEAARLNLFASREDLNAAAMTLTAGIAERWIDIIARRQEKALLQKQLQANKTSLELIELRFENSMASALDVFQQREAVAKIEASIPQVEAREQLLLHELALLMGKAPGQPIDISYERLPAVGDLPAAGIPADLLAARPDIRTAGLRLYAARWQVREARANRLPAIRLTAKAGYGAEKMKDIFDNWLTNLAANLTAPIFEGKRLSSEVDRTKAVEDERLTAYRRTVLGAIKDVEDAIVGEEKQKEQIKAVERQLLFARKALDEARERYMRGLNDYLPVLTEQASVNTLERDLLQRSRDLVLIRISLYRALGGRWMDELKKS